jgi:hypothetical protein
MFKSTATLLLSMSLSSLFAGSPRATDIPSSLANLSAEISIEDIAERGDGTPGFSRRSITAVLRHARGKAIERSDLGLEVNGVAMEFRVSTGNYYDRHPYYRLAEKSSVTVKPATEYVFTLVLPGGTRHLVGKVKTPAALELAQFDFTTRRPASGDVTFGWRDLVEPASLTLFRSDTWKESDGTLVNEAGSPNDPAALRRAIAGGWFRKSTDRLKVPAEFLATKEGRTLATLGAEVRVANEGRIEKTFAKESTLRAERRLLLRMVWVEVE